MTMNKYIDGLVQDCSNSIANALKLLQPCTKSSICISQFVFSNGCRQSNVFLLTYWGPEKMVIISQTIFSHFVEWKLLYFNSTFTEICSQGSSHHSQSPINCMKDSGQNLNLKHTRHITHKMYGTMAPSYCLEGRWVNGTYFYYNCTINTL